MLIFRGGNTHHGCANGQVRTEFECDVIEFCTVSTTFLQSCQLSARYSRFKNGLSACGVILPPCLLPSLAPSKSTIAEWAVTRNSIIQVSRDVLTRGIMSRTDLDYPIERRTLSAMPLVLVRLSLSQCDCFGTLVSKNYRGKRQEDPLEQVQNRLALLGLETDDPTCELFVDKECFGACHRVRSNLSIPKGQLTILV